MLHSSLGGFQLNGSAATLYDLLDQCETHSASFDGVSRFERCKHSKDLVVIIFRNSWPVVVNDEFNSVAMVH